MNIEKIKNYNQKLLAVLGSIAVLFGIIGLLMMVFFFIQDLTRSSRYNNPDEGILSEEKIEELQKENKRKQLISFETPRLVDSLNLVYVIPVSHKTLESEESIIEHEDKVMGLLDTRSYKFNKRASRHYYGDFNNLLIYDYKNQTTDKLFANRVNFENIQSEYFSDDIFVLFKASSGDTNKDGVINQDDLKTLFLYTLKDKRLTEIALEDADISDIKFVENSKNLIINFGLDYNKDGKFNSYLEPSVIKKYDFENKKLVDIVSQDINNELQKMLEGSN